MKTYGSLHLPVCLWGTSRPRISLSEEKMLDTLTASLFLGRGYTNDGMSKAATFWKHNSVLTDWNRTQGKIFCSLFHIPLIHFPVIWLLTINGEKLIPGKDFIVAAETKSIHASFR